MESYLSHIDLSVLIFATFAGLAAGLVKGVVGFGMPMILLSLSLIHISEPTRPY